MADSPIPTFLDPRRLMVSNFLTLESCVTIRLTTKASDSLAVMFLNDVQIHLPE